MILIFLVLIFFTFKTENKKEKSNFLKNVKFEKKIKFKEKNEKLEDFFYNDDKVIRFLSDNFEIDDTNFENIFERKNAIDAKGSDCDIIHFAICKKVVFIIFDKQLNKITLSVNFEEKNLIYIHNQSKENSSEFFLHVGLFYENYNGILGQKFPFQKDIKHTSFIIYYNKELKIFEEKYFFYDENWKYLGYFKDDFLEFFTSDFKIEF